MHTTVYQIWTYAAHVGSRVCEIPVVRDPTIYLTRERAEAEMNKFNETKTYIVMYPMEEA